jgi:hypothetical protein
VDGQSGEHLSYDHDPATLLRRLLTSLTKVGRAFGLSRRTAVSAQAAARPHSAGRRGGHQCGLFELVNRLADALAVTAVERQHLLDLVDYQHSPPEPYDSRSPQRRPVITDIQQEAVDSLFPHPAAYVDETWAVLYTNSEYCRIYRRLCDIGNVLIWFFGEPQSRQIMVEWEIEARLTVAWVRAHMVRRPGDKAFDDLLEELYRFPDFVTMWQRQEILMGRHTPYMRVRDLDNGKDLMLLAQVYRGPDPTEAVQLYLGIRTDSVDSLDLIPEAIAKRPT